MSRFLCTFKLASMLLAGLACLTSCELDTGLPLDPTNDIAAFELRMADNPSLSRDVTGEISDSNIVLNVPASTDVTSLVPTIQYIGEDIFPASGEAQDFSDPVEYTVTAADGGERVYGVTVYVAADNSKDIRSFRVGDKLATVEGQNISLTLPYGTDLSSLSPVIGHTGATISPESNTAQDFSSPVRYTVSAQDGSTKVYTVTINTAASNAKQITEFKVGGVSAQINGTQIALTLPYGTDLRALEPTIAHTGGSVEPESGSAQDFRGPVTYTVTAADGSSQDYLVTVSLAPSSAKDITAFSIDGASAQVSGSAISITLPYGTDVTYLAPSVQHTGKNVSPASGAPRDFTQPLVYRVTAADGSSKQYTVTVSVAPNTANQIIDFVILGSTGDINGTTITLTLPFGAELSALIPTIVHSGSQVTPASGVTRDFSDPAEYVVTAADGSTRTYTVIVSVAESNSNIITQFTLLNVDAMVTDGAISVTFPFGTDVSDLAPQVTHTGASIEPASGIARNFASEQTYTVTAANGETRVYTVTVAIASNTAKTITSFSLLGHEAEIDGTDITLTVPPGSVVSALTPEITHTGATIEPAEDEAQDFSEPVTYTVKAANNTTATYTVTVTVAQDDAREITGFSIGNAQGQIGVGTIAVTVPFGTSRTSLAPSITISGVSVSPGSGVARDFTQPVTYTVTAEDGQTKDYTVTVNEAPSDAKAITSFVILGKSASIVGNSIAVTLPFGTSPSALDPTIGVTGKKVEPASGVPRDFSDPVSYRVTAVDDTFIDYTVTVTIAQNDAKNITGFTIQGVPADIGTDTITLTLPYGTSRTSLTPTITISGDSVTPPSHVPQDFTSPRTYTVQANDGTEKQYTVTVQNALNHAKDILSFNILGVTPSITSNTVSLTVPFGTNPAALTPTISFSGVEITPASGVSQNFTDPVEYTVEAENGDTKVYTVTVTVARSDAKEITSFAIGNATGVIGTNTIAVTVPYGSIASSLTPTISSTGVLVAPASGVVNDFTSPTNYVVAADDGSTKTYLVTVSVAANDAKDISSFSILGVPGNIVGNAISLTVPYGNDASALTPTIAISGQTVAPASGAVNNFSSPATYTVTAEDGTMKAYTVTVNVAQNSAKDITGFTILGVPGNIVGSAISLTVPYGTDPSSLTPTIMTSGQSVSPASGSPHSFSSPATYTVTAEDGTMKAYTVTVNVAQNSAKDITGFTILGVPGNIVGSAISLTVPYGADPSSLTPTIMTSGQSVSPASGSPHSFSSPATYTVTAEDGTMKAYTVTVNVAQNTAKDISTFKILGVDGVVGPNTIAITLPYGADPSSLTPTITHTGQTVSPASGALTDFTSPATYTVTAEDGSTKPYTVTVTIAQNSAKDITAFSILGETGVIGTGTVAVTVPFGTDRSSLTPSITISGQSVSPMGGMAQNFTSPVTYTVTAEDGTTQDYAVTVTVAANSANDISTFSILGLSGTVGASSVSLTVPYGTSLSALTPTVTFTGASVNPPSGMVLDFSNPVTYTVTADNGSTKPYTVTVSNAGAAIDCRALLTAFPATTSGVHTIDPDGAGAIAPFPVYCDMTNNGGGWTLIGKVAAGDYTALSNTDFQNLIVNPGSDVNVSSLQSAAVPVTGEIAFFSKEKTNALYHASGALRAVRVNMSGHALVSAANGTYFQQRVSAPGNWDFWLALRNARLWNSDGAADTPVNPLFVARFGTDFVLTNQVADFNTGTNVVTHRGDGTYGFFNIYTHTLPDGVTTVAVSRHFGLLNDGVANIGFLWLLTADPTDGTAPTFPDTRYKHDTASLQKSLIWLR